MIFFILAACIVLAGLIHDYRLKADQKTEAKAQAEWQAAFNASTAQEALMQQRRYDAIQREADAKINKLKAEQVEAEALAKRAVLWKHLQPDGL